MNKTYFEGYLKTNSFGVLSVEYPLFSYCNKSEPGAGSPCDSVSKLDYVNDELVRVVAKRNGDFVAYYKTIVLKFWKSRYEIKDVK